MNVQHPNGGTAKATTPPRHLLVTALVGGALVGFLVMKTPEARARLETAADMARRLGELSERDAQVIAVQLAKTSQPRSPSAI